DRVFGHVATQSPKRIRILVDHRHRVPQVDQPVRQGGPHTTAAHDHDVHLAPHSRRDRSAGPAVVTGARSVTLWHTWPRYVAAVPEAAPTCPGAVRTLVGAGRLVTAGGCVSAGHPKGVPSTRGWRDGPCGHRIRDDRRRRRARGMVRGASPGPGGVRTTRTAR